MPTPEQTIAVAALTQGAFLMEPEIIMGLDTQPAGDDLIVTRSVIGSLTRARKQRWRIAPDGSPRLELDGTRLN